MIAVEREQVEDVFTKDPVLVDERNDGTAECMYLILGSYDVTRNAVFRLVILSREHWFSSNSAG